jgi:hypothetical protein
LINAKQNLPNKSIQTITIKSKFVPGIIIYLFLSLLLSSATHCNMASPKPSKSTIYNVTPPREVDLKPPEYKNDQGKSSAAIDTNSMSDVSPTEAPFPSKRDEN